MNCIKVIVNCHLSMPDFRAKSPMSIKTDVHFRLRLKK